MKRSASEPSGDGREKRARDASASLVSLSQLESCFNAINEGPFRIVFLHQLYSLPSHLCENKTCMDTYISELKDQGSVRTFFTMNGISLMFMSDYVNSIHTMMEKVSQKDSQTSKEALRKMKIWGQRYPHTSVTKRQLMTGVIEGQLSQSHQDKDDDNSSSNGKTCKKEVSEVDENCMTSITCFTEEEIDLLLQLKFLQHRRDVDVSNVFYMHHPGLSQILTVIDDMRRLIVSAIQRSRYKELSEENIAKIRSKQVARSVLSIQYYLLDLMGKGKILKITTPANKRMYRLK